MAEAILDRIRSGLKSRGSMSQRGLASVLRNLDNNRNRQLDAEEISSGLSDYGVKVSKAEAATLISSFDRDGSGTLNLDEFLRAVRGDLNEARKKVALLAFAKFDKDGSGEISFNDISGVYNAKNHPKVRAGELTERQVLDGFLQTFEGTKGNKDGKISQDEWLDYYADISASIDTDDYFEEMVRSAWKL
eukprot:ANDGO_05640.mRNA.1 Crustacean calcium-binding protein 23